MQDGQVLRDGSRVPDRIGPNHFCLQSVTFAPRFVRAFTLIEIMMVVAIIGLVMTMTVPAILRTMHQQPLRKAVSDVVKICSNARSQAILHGETTTVVFHPQSLEVALAGAARAADTNDDFIPIGREATAAAAAKASPLNSAKFDDSINIDMLDVNLRECKEAKAVGVRFFPNGTSDEMTLILDAGGQYRKISLEVTTALTSVEVIK